MFYGPWFKSSRSGRWLLPGCRHRAAPRAESQPPRSQEQDCHGAKVSAAQERNSARGRLLGWFSPYQQSSAAEPASGSSLTAVARVWCLRHKVHPMTWERDLILEGGAALTINHVSPPGWHLGRVGRVKPSAARSSLRQGNGCVPVCLTKRLSRRRISSFGAPRRPKKPEGGFQSEQSAANSSTRGVSRLQRGWKVTDTLPASQAFPAVQVWRERVTRVEERRWALTSPRLERAQPGRAYRTSRENRGVLRVALV